MLFIIKCIKEHFVERDACFDGDARNSKHFVDVYIPCNVIIYYLQTYPKYAL